MKDDCVFCKIIKGELPCFKIAENDYALAFLDISGDCYGHTLVIPKEHFTNVIDCEKKYLSEVVGLAQTVAKHYVDDCGFDGVNILNASGKEAGQTVFHLHFHIIPRKDGDGLNCWPNFPGEKTSLEEIHKKLAIKEKKAKKIAANGCVVLYTDGACSNNPGIGGYCSILNFNGKEKIISGGEKETTNNRMELMGVIKGLQALKDGAMVEVFSDSAYVVNAFEQGWLASWQKNGWKTSGKSDVLNADLWKVLLKETERVQVAWNKVKGHADNELNNRCDEIARGEVAKIKAEIEEK